MEQRALRHGVACCLPGFLGEISLKATGLRLCPGGCGDQARQGMNRNNGAQSQVVKCSRRFHVGDGWNKVWTRIRAGFKGG